MKLKVTKHKTPHSLSIPWKKLRAMLEREGVKLPNKWTEQEPTVRLARAGPYQTETVVLEWYE